MDRLQQVREKRLRKDALLCGLQARKATAASTFSRLQDVAGLWDFARVGDVGEPGDDSTLSGLMSFDQAREWIAETLSQDQRP